MVAKFYRPGRWSEAQIKEEHQFMAEILEAEVPVVVPHYFSAPGDTLRQTPNHLFYCVYPKVGGRQPEDLPEAKLEQLGRLIARMHGVGVQKKAYARVSLTPQNYGVASLQFLLGEQFVPPHSERRFQKIVEEIIAAAEEAFRGQPLQRIHGDCHAGNILWNEKTGPSFIDFDDMVNGPPIQDLWLLAPDPESLIHLVNGYHQMRDLPQGSLRMVEPLRALRMIHYATWIAKRYDDPAFQKAFPHFESPKYWDELTYDLEKQMNRIEEAKSR
jgi:Ser/Thr protein kinase RdoA (MazF antagonist)